MADEPLLDYLDRMIYTLYGATQRGIGYVPRSPLHSEVVEYIEDDRTGRPVPVEDAADHYLLRSFDLIRQDPWWLSHTKVSMEQGSVYRYGVREETNECVGEIPWRNKHIELCRTCCRSIDENSLICSAGHLDIRTMMTTDQPGKVREISRAIPLRKEDEE